MEAEPPKFVRQVTEQTPFKDPGDDAPPPPAPGNVDFWVLGSGVSTAVPILSHVLNRECPQPSVSKRKSDGRAVCEEAYLNPNSKNRRFNVSLLARYMPADGGELQTIMIDAGKTMRQSVLNLFPRLGLTSVNAVIITHGHADAMQGMDDMRDLQRQEHVYDGDEFIGYRAIGGAMRITSNKATLKLVRQVYPYLCGAPDLAAPGVLRRRVAWIEFDEIEDDCVVELAGLPVKVFPVWHGGKYVSLGFAFGPKKGLNGDAGSAGDVAVASDVNNQCRTCTPTDFQDACGYSFLYISDVKDIPPETMAWLERVAQIGIDLLAVDALSRNPHTTHFHLDAALDFVRKLRPKRTILVGMSSCGIGDHDETNAELALLAESEGLHVELAYDGMQLPEYAARM